MLEKFKEEVYKANMDLPKYGSGYFTWGMSVALTVKRDCS